MHNAKAFDAQFIFKYLVEKSGIKEEPRVILNGNENYCYDDWSYKIY